MYSESKRDQSNSNTLNYFDILSVMETVHDRSMNNCFLCNSLSTLEISLLGDFQHITGLRTLLNNIQKVYTKRMQ